MKAIVGIALVVAACGGYEQSPDHTPANSLPSGMYVRTFTLLSTNCHFNPGDGLQDVVFLQSVPWEVLETDDTDFPPPVPATDLDNCEQHCFAHGDVGPLGVTDYLMICHWVECKNRDKYVNTTYWWNHYHGCYRRYEIVWRREVR